MHPSAYANAIKFYQKYCYFLSDSSFVLDIGSYDVSGCLKPIFQKHRYIGVDMVEGPNVNITCSNENIPFKDNFFDVIVSSSCFEHDDFFWLTFLEMGRLLKTNGFIYINAPSNGPYHAHPQDNWRFYIDSWKALEKWAKRNNQNINLVESYIDKDNATENGAPLWEDSVAIYQKIS